MVVPTGRQMIQWRSAALSDRGRLRQRNEDAFLLRPDARLAAVADGMGGHAAGDVASRLAIEQLDSAFVLTTSQRAGAVGRRLVAAFEAANDALLEQAATTPALRGMGTTLTALCTLPDAPQVVIAHIGDSRAYRLRHRSLRQLTIDHTWVQQQVDAGMLTPQQARSHPWSSMLERVLGTPAVGPADTYVVDAEPGDIFLLCSDGLTCMIDDFEIAALLSRDLPLDTHAEQLVDAANLRGGRDNITVVLIAAN
jgi:serine/threonine protein phosphatase PrpC